MFLLEMGSILSINRMVLNYSLIALISFFTICQLSGQVQETDSLSQELVPEIIVYEDDTIFVAPDTILVIDTIVHYVKIKEPVLRSKRELGIIITNNFNSFDKQIDSIALRANPGYRLGIQFITYKQHFAWYIHVGYESVHNRINFKDSYEGTGEEVGGVYDSLTITSSYEINDYLDLLYLQLGIGKRWGSKKIIFSVYTYGMYAFLYKQTSLDHFFENVPNELSVVSTIKNNFSLGIRSDLGCKLTSNFIFHIGPSFQYRINNKKSTLFGSSGILGVTYGLSILF